MASSRQNVQDILDELISVASQRLQEMDVENTYHLVQELGHGGFGSVLMVIQKETAQPMAMKLLHRKKTTESSFLKEISIAYFLSSHPNIIGIYGIAFRTNDFFGYTQELATYGNLRSLIPPNEGLPKDVVKNCAFQISSALDFMESKGLVHLDIKPENILVFYEDCHLFKITDFGLSQVKGSMTIRRTGTKSYMAPEIRQLTKQKPLVIDPSLDVWSFGVVLYILLTGTSPWKSADPTDQEYCNFVEWQNNFGRMDPPSQWRRLSPEVHTMLSGLLAIDSNRRSKCTAVLMFLGEHWKESFSESTDSSEANIHLWSRSHFLSLPPVFPSSEILLQNITI
ncbi:serine/threonine-protein kinase SBK1-like [Dendropsophus ebraccatus]|uniref:serine/threonine-protein kinase SBK1-like n=1 Tax=Dendropsophus ebraccatus TaxID=150705 RepID=UPI003831CECC